MCHGHRPSFLVAGGHASVSRENRQPRAVISGNAGMPFEGTLEMAHIQGFDDTDVSVSQIFGFPSKFAQPQTRLRLRDGSRSVKPGCHVCRCELGVRR